MSQTEFAVNFFVALFALIDPVGNVPLFAAATAGVKARDSRDDQASTSRCSCSAS